MDDTTPTLPDPSEFFVVSRRREFYLIHYPCRTQIVHTESLSLDTLTRAANQHVCPHPGND